MENNITIPMSDNLERFLSMFAKDLDITKEAVAHMILDGHRLAIVNYIFNNSEVKNA